MKRVIPVVPEAISYTNLTGMFHQQCVQKPPVRCIFETVIFQIVNILTSVLLFLPLRRTQVMRIGEKISVYSISR